MTSSICERPKAAPLTRSWLAFTPSVPVYSVARMMPKAKARIPRETNSSGKEKPSWPSWTFATVDHRRTAPHQAPMASTIPPSLAPISRRDGSLPK